MGDAVTPTLSLDAVTKSFGQVEVLHGVDLTLNAGEVHALIGENGAGKSTIMKILGGFLAPTSGRVLLDGQPAPYSTGPQAETAGVIVIHQEFNLAPDLSVAANIFLGREISRGLRLDHAAMRAAAGDLLAQLDTTIRPDALIRDLSVPDRQMVEIAKALSRRARVLIMDEPSAALTHREVDALYAQVDRLRAEGVALMFCSHRLDEVERLADRITVLRDGAVVGRATRGGMTQDGMATAMVGRQLADIFPPKPSAAGDEMLRVEGVTVPGRVENASLTLRRGEVLGIAGLVGSGRTELAEAIAGLRSHNGRVTLMGQPLTIRAPADALAAGIAYLTEDRKGLGLFLDMSCGGNINLGVIARDERMAVIVISHDHGFLERWCDRVVDVSAGWSESTLGDRSGS